MKRLSDDDIKSLKKYIKEHNDEFDIYGVNVHSVGFEFRLYSKDDRPKLSYISLEDILSRHYSLYMWDKDMNTFEFKLTESQHEMLYRIIDKYWKQTGERFQDRGLY